MIFLKFSPVSLLLLAPAQGIQYPVGISNCHYNQWFDKAPERVAVASSGAVELMLSMGLADRILHSSWVKEVWEPLDEDFQKFKHYPKYPPAQDFIDSKPDFYYATYSSAFEDPSDPGRLVDYDRLNITEVLGLTKPCELLIESNSYGDNKTYCRKEMHDVGMNTYLASSYCEFADYRPEDVSLDVLYQEVWDLAIIFDVVDNARNLVDGIEDHFEQALAISQVGAAEPIRVFWLDMFLSKSNPDETRPFVGACCGGPQIIMDKAGAVNVFENQGKEDRRIWDRVSWENIVASDPDLIVLIELSTESAAEKLFNLCSDPVLREMRAVQERQFLVLPFAASNVGVRLGAATYNMAEAISALARGKPLNALEFTKNAEDASATSGLKVWTTLPTFEGTNLETFCPGSPRKIVIKEVSEMEERGMETGQNGLAGWATALIAILAVSGVVLSIFVFQMVQKEKAGTPMFGPLISKEGGESA